MTDTSKDVERLIADCHFSAFETGQSLYTSCAETISALAAQLEDANARAARARDDALGDAAEICIDHVLRREDLDAIFALRTQPPASAEPVTAPTTAQIMADARVKALVDALENADRVLRCAADYWDNFCNDAERAPYAVAVDQACSALAQLKEPT